VVLHVLVIQLGYLAIWGIILAGGLIALRRGRTDGAMAVLFGAGLQVLLEVLTLGMMVLQTRHMIEPVAAARISRVVWVPQLVGGFLFALGFLRLVKAMRRDE
jgi:hypothetical protein